MVIFSPHIRGYGFRNPGIFLLVESGIQLMKRNFTIQECLGFPYLGQIHCDQLKTFSVTKTLAKTGMHKLNSYNYNTVKFRK